MSGTAAVMSGFPSESDFEQQDLSLGSDRKHLDLAASWPSGMSAIEFVSFNTTESPQATVVLAKCLLVLFVCVSYIYIC